MSEKSVSDQLLRESIAPKLSAAMDAWRTVLGSNRVLSDDATRAQYGTDCGLKDVHPAAVLLPGSLLELQEVVKIAYRLEVPIHSISRGQNWGYGSAAPTMESSVIVDLRRMNRIVEVNRELAYAVVEPGVTQEQLYDHLRAHAPELCMDVTGASPDSSILGNLSERGYGQTPYGDRFAHSSGMEVLLADGTLLKTSFGHYSASSSHHLYKWGIGPFIDGLFTQSNFGIITKVGMWLMPVPEHIGLLMVRICSTSNLARVATKLRDLKLRGLLPATVHISNDIRLLSCVTQFPYHLESGQSGLSDAVRANLRKKFGVAPWSCFTSLRGSRREVASSLREIRLALKGEAKVIFISNDSVSRAARFGFLYKVFTGHTLAQVKMLYGLASGKPLAAPTLGAFWRHRTGPEHVPMNPARDSSGMVWCAPVLPCTAKDVATFVNLIDTIMGKFGFESNLTLTMISERALCCTVGITFDRGNDTNRAKACYDEVLEQCVVRGFIPYRHGINVEQARHLLFDERDPYWRTCQAIKDVLDTRHILSPGRYGIR